MREVLLTGAHTLAGAEVLAVLLRRPDVERVRLLVPRRGSEELLRRLERFCCRFEDRVVPVVRDPRVPGLGLGPVARRELAGAVDTVLHCAERQAPDQRLRTARRVNVEPVSDLLELLALRPDLRLVHLSTAFVGGDRSGLFTEFDLDCGQGFRNAYERSKFDAEVRLRASDQSHRVTVVRASHTVGSSRTGAAFSRGGFQPLLDALCCGRGWLSGDPEARVDLVPADVLAAAVLALAEEPGAAGRTFHLVAGWQRSIPVRELLLLAAGGRRNGSRGPVLLPRVAAPAARLASALVPGGPDGVWFHAARDYLRQTCVFDDFLARDVLSRRGISVPRPESYLDRVLAARSAELDSPSGDSV